MNKSENKIVPLKRQGNNKSSPKKHDGCGATKKKKLAGESFSPEGTSSLGLISQNFNYYLTAVQSLILELISYTLALDRRNINDS